MNSRSMSGINSGGDGGDVFQNGDNVFTGTNTYNVNLPTSNVTPTSGTQLITKSFADATYSAGGSNTNDYVTGFSRNAVTGAVTITQADTGTPITSESYTSITDSQINAIGTNTSNISTNTGNITTNASNITTNASNISTNASNISTNGTNISNLTTATNPCFKSASLAGQDLTLTPISGTATVITIPSGTGDAVLAGANAFTSTNTFNNNRPTSTLTSTIAATDFITKQNADTLYTNNTGDAVLAGTNAFTSTNTFNTKRPTSTLTSTPASTDFITKQNGDALYGGGQIQQTGYENEFADNTSYAVAPGNPSLSGNAQGNNFGGRMNNVLNADIEIPSGHSGKVLVSFNVSGEWSTAPYDKGVILGRATLSGTTFTYDKLIRADPSSTRGLFISNFLISYQQDFDSTLEQCSGAIMDDTITAGNTYRYTPILVNTNAQNSRTFKLNQTINSSTSLVYERACSSVIAQLVNISP